LEDRRRRRDDRGQTTEGRSFKALNIEQQNTEPQNDVVITSIFEIPCSIFSCLKSNDSGPKPEVGGRSPGNESLGSVVIGSSSFVVNGYGAKRGGRSGDATEIEKERLNHVHQQKNEPHIFGACGNSDGSQLPNRRECLQRIVSHCRLWQVLRVVLLSTKLAMSTSRCGNGLTGLCRCFLCLAGVTEVGHVDFPSIQVQSKQTQRVSELAKLVSRRDGRDGRSGETGTPACSWRFS
jgi:hypothetical protein